MRSITLCLSLVLCVASETTCNSEDGECVAQQTVSLLQTNLDMQVKVKPHVVVDASEPAQKDTTSVTNKKHEKAAAAKATDPKPFFTEETMPAVSTTNQCIITLAFQYFGLYTALAIVRTLASFKYDVVGIEGILETGCTTITYAPMLCVLFLAARLRANQLSQDQNEKYELPQHWVQKAMLGSSFAVIAQVVLVLIVGFMSGMSNVKTDEEGNLDLSEVPNQHPLVVQVLSVARYVAMLFLYGGTCVVVIGINAMEAPKEIWGDEEPPVSPAVKCTIMLTGIFFLIYLLVAITKTISEVMPSIRSVPGLVKLEASAGIAKMTVNFAPMLCILFIGARMRALQIDPKHGNPQPWAQKCFYLCTASVLIQAILAMVLPFVAGGEAKRGACEGDVSFPMENQMLGAVMTALRYACLFAVYGGASTVVYSVFVIEDTTHPDLTPVVSPALQCSIMLTTQYFLIYTLLFVCITVKSFVLTRISDAVPALAAQATKACDLMMAICDAGRATVMFAPMLACMFIGARMRALQLTKSADGTNPPTAGPQKWVQDGMYMSTYAVFIQIIMTMLVTLLTGVDKPETDKDGSVKMPQGTNTYFAVSAEIVRYTVLVMMYLGACIVAAGVVLMTPETCQPYSVHGLTDLW